MSRLFPPFSPSPRRLIKATLVAALWAGVGIAAQPAQAAPPAPSAVERDEAPRLRAELAKVNTEIDALKRSDRGVRDEARLRARLADAEALARRLNALERTTELPAPSSLPSPARAVGEAPSDGPGEWDAKADILTDRARRLAGAAADLERRLGAFERRQELKRRAGQLEHDPFAAFETSKRHVVVNGAVTPAFAPQVPGPTKAADSPARGETSVSNGSGAPTSGGGTASGPSGPTGLTAGDASTKGATASGAATVLPPSANGAESSSPALSLQLRDALDPATLGDLRRLEASGQSADRVRAYRRAIDALKAEQATLDAEASGLRAKARSGSTR